jgi:hypothetical protein
MSTQDDWQIIHCPNELSGPEFLQALRDLEALNMIRFTVGASSGSTPFASNDGTGHVRVEVKVISRQQSQLEPVKKTRKRA